MKFISLWHLQDHSELIPILILKTKEMWLVNGSGLLCKSETSSETERIKVNQVEFKCRAWWKYRAFPNADEGMTNSKRRWKLTTLGRRWDEANEFAKWNPGLGRVWILGARCPLSFSLLYTLPYLSVIRYNIQPIVRLYARVTRYNGSPPQQPWTSPTHRLQYLVRHFRIISFKYECWYISDILIYITIRVWVVNWIWSTDGWNDELSATCLAVPCDGPAVW